MKKIFPVLMLALWMAAILTLFFIVQKPDFLSILAGLKNLLLIIFIPFLMAGLAACMGAYLLPDSDPVERLILGTAMGMGIFGLTGFGLAISGWAKPDVLLTILLALTGYFTFTGKLSRVCEDAKRVVEEIHDSAKSVSLWIPISAGIAIGLAFLMSLAPPVEDFDALLYHLTVPSWWLRDGSLIQTSNPTYWYPQNVEGSFVLPLALGVDTSTHLIHLLWLVLIILLLWFWTRKTWDNAVAWDTILIVLTMPSLLWLASWAYIDYALAFTSLAALYSLWKWKDTQSKQWILTSGIMAGLGMSIKYSGFALLFTGVLMIIIWGKEILQRIEKAFYFSAAAILVASPWYIRNWVWTGNPIYPFVFGGRLWDSFLAQAFPMKGTGIGWNIGHILMLPLTVTLGTHGMNLFDGRIGPFFLILAPPAIYIFWNSRHEQNRPRWALEIIGVFSLIGIGTWALGVINSEHLFQTRYLFPALIPMTVPLAIGLNSLYKLDLQCLKISFIVRFMMAFVVFVNLFNFGLQTLVRNPVSAALGIISRERYMEKRQPGYAGALILVNKLSDNIKIYLLFEPRSYGMNAHVQPDVINTNFSHDLWLYGTPEKIITAWQKQGYTHVLLSRTGADFIFQNDPSLIPNEKLLLGQVERLLLTIGETPNGDYILYEIPSR